MIKKSGTSGSVIMIETLIWHHLVVPAQSIKFQYLTIFRFWFTVDKYKTIFSELGDPITGTSGVISKSRTSARLSISRVKK